MAVSSLVVEALPECAIDVKLALQGIGGVEVHEVRSHKLVVTIEAASAEESHAIASSFIAIPGVTGVSLVYLNIEEDLDGACDESTGAGFGCACCEAGPEEGFEG